MVNFLLSTYDFNNETCYSMLKHYLEPGMSVCIVPYSHDVDFYESEELFDSYYHYDTGEDFNSIARAYHDYGIDKGRIRVINPNRDTYAMIKHKILSSDVLFFTGGNPVHAMMRMQPILSIINQFDGIVMGASAGAMVQVYEFVMDGEGVPYSYHKGLGMIMDNVDVLVHFHIDSHMIKIIRRSLKERPNVHLLPLVDGDILCFP